MRIVVSGGTGVIGRAAVPALRAEGHDVAVLSDSPLEGPDGAEPADAETVVGDPLDVDSLVRAYAGADAVISLAGRMPSGFEAVRPKAWRRHDLLRTVGVGNVVAAAREAGVRRIVQESGSFLYADNGDDWINEDHRLEITRATEPLAVAETHVQGYTCGSRAGVILRFGWLVGDEPLTRRQLRGATRGRPVGLGAPERWIHLLHTDDIGSAVVAALVAPSGVYNVGAEPVRRHEVVSAYAAAAGVGSLGSAGPVLRRLAATRLEPMTRSLRVCSEHFCAHTGWTPSRPRFEVSWLDSALEAVAEGVQ